jgi:hypothetical protein
MNSVIRRVVSGANLGRMKGQADFINGDIEHRRWHALYCGASLCTRAMRTSNEHESQEAAYDPELTHGADNW